MNKQTGTYGHARTFAYKFPATAAAPNANLWVDHRAASVSFDINESQ